MVGESIEVVIKGAEVGRPVTFKLVIIVPSVPVHRVVGTGKTCAVPFVVGTVLIDTSGMIRDVVMGTVELGLKVSIDKMVGSTVWVCDSTAGDCDKTVSGPIVRVTTIGGGSTVAVNDREVGKVQSGCCILVGAPRTEIANKHVNRILAFIFAKGEVEMEN